MPRRPKNASLAVRGLYGSNWVRARLTAFTSLHDKSLSLKVYELESKGQEALFREVGEYIRQQLESRSPQLDCGKGKVLEHGTMDTSDFLTSLP